MLRGFSPGPSNAPSPVPMGALGMQQGGDSKAAPTRRLGDRFILGEELGRGAVGTVYKGMDTTTGDTVAIKQISLAGISAADNLAAVMGEIELLKTLNHKNIVKYIGSFKSRTHLYIILEFMENGALSAIIKPNRFGVFPETLVAVYIAQVLQGLQYLHDQGVVHRDIKGANILTTKEGLVKLADFGVATKLGELEDRREDLQQHVVGTPYWMAPEVIEMTQVSAASDIWSVGCLIIELLTGSPPYYDLQPMSALFRIVQDDQPPLPDSLTPLLQDFLRQCFQKDPRKRPSAAALLQHEWIRQNRRTLQTSWKRGQAMTARGSRPVADHESVTSVISRMMAAEEEMGEEGGREITAGGAAPMPDPHAGSVPPVTPASHFILSAQDGSPATPSPSLPGPPLGSGVVPAGGGSMGRPHITPSPLRDGAMGPGQAAAYTQPLGMAATGAPIPLPPIQSLIPSQSLTRQQQQPNGLASQASGRAVPGQQAWGIQANGGLPGQGQQGPGMVTGVPPIWGAAPGAVITGGAAAPSGPGPITSLVSLLGGTPQQIGGHLAPWLEDADRGHLPSVQPAPGFVMSASRPGPLTAGLTSLTLPPPGSQADVGVQGPGAPVETDPLGAPMSSTMLELRRQVRELVSALRPHPGAPRACHELAALITRVPEAKQLMLTETGALMLLELLDSDQVAARERPYEDTLKHQFADGAIEVLMALTADDVLTLETICLLGIVPAAARYALPPYPRALRMRAAQFVSRLFDSSHSTLTHFVACQGLKQLVAMVADSPGPGVTTSIDSPGLALTQIAIRCIYQFLDRYSILPHSYLCRLLAQNGLVPRLYLVLKQTTNFLSKRSSGVGPSTFQGAVYGKGVVSANAAYIVDSRPLRSQQGGGALGGGGLMMGSEDAALVGVVLTTEELVALQDAIVSLLLLLSNADALVKGYMCTRDTLQQHLDCLSKLQPPALVRLMRAMRWLTCEHGMLPAIKEAGAIATLVPFLSRERLLEMQGQAQAQLPQQQQQAGATGPQQGMLLALQVQVEALHALHNICKLNKVHLEAAATVGIIPHLVRIANEGLQAMMAAAQAAAAALAASGPGPSSGQQHNQPQVLPLSVGEAAEAAAASDEASLLDPLARWARLRGFVVTMLVNLVSCSSSTRAKLWAASGLDVFLHLLAEQESVELGALSALDVWLSEDHSRLEARLTQRDPIAQLVGLYARIAQAQNIGVLPQLLTTLRQMIGRSSKLAVALAVGGLVPWLLAMIDPAAPIIRVKLLEIIRCLYEHYPRPKEFLLVYRIPDVLRRLLETQGRGTDAVHQEAQRLLTAFQINVLW